jgi:hypothetical protein
VKTRFQSLLSNSTLYRYVTEGKYKDVSCFTMVGLYTLIPVDPYSLKAAWFQPLNPPRENLLSLPGFNP